MNTPANAGAAAHALVDDVTGHHIVLSESTHRHFLRVLRLRVGETVTVTDGRGAWRTTVVPRAFGDDASLEPTGDTQTVVRLAPSIALGVAVAKGDKPEFVVQKLTELGVDAISFFHGDRSVAKWNDDKVLRNLERLRSVATEALQQSRGVFMPVVGWIPDLAVHVSATDRTSGIANGVQVRRADINGSLLDVTASQLLLIGPEGGWSAREAELGDAVSLGAQVLRAETAAVVGATLLIGLRSGMVRSVRTAGS